MTVLVGGAVSFQGYLVITRTVRREAEARVQDAVRVARRLILAGLDRSGSDRAVVEDVTAGEAAESPSLSVLERAAEGAGTASGVVLLDRGLCLAEARRDPGTGSIAFAVRPLRDENGLVDQVRELIFGAQGEADAPRATLTVFERDVRIATNVVTSRGERAVGTRAAPEVADRVLGRGQPWNDRARVLDRWTIASYEPMRAADGEVVGMLYAGLDEEFYTAEGRRSLALFLASTAGLTLLVSAAVWGFARRVVAPLRALTEAAETSGAVSPRPIAVDPGAPREIRILGETFNRMAGRIEAHTTELEASRAKAQKALKDYMEVLGFVAHELKSPLAGARMQLGTIDDGYVGEVPAAMKPPLAALRRALDYGLEVAQSFNQLSRAEGEGFQARIVEIPDFGADVVRTAMSDFAGLAAARRMELTLEGEAGPLRGDPDLLRVVLDNLLGNAVKYGREDTTVRVAMRRTPSGRRVEVRNEGVGVADDRRGRLFEKFYRVHDPVTRTAKGTGIGLYLVRRFVELQGGTVGVEGEYGSWISFWFELPAGQGLAPAPGS
jgi:two-component system NtrC family sensor kinase